jgi:hypothetical protein
VPTTNQPPRWFTSSYSANNGACVECAEIDGGMTIRDTKDRQGPVLHADRDTWTGVVAAIKTNSLRH